MSKIFQCFKISLLIVCISSSTHLCFNAEGRKLVATPQSQEEKLMLRARIGSLPPRCEWRCSSCGHCKAIQVPSSSQINENWDYKPMSWKCKCGNLIFNP